MMDLGSFLKDILTKLSEENSSGVTELQHAIGKMFIESVERGSLVFEQSDHLRIALA